MSVQEVFSLRKEDSRISSLLNGRISSLLSDSLVVVLVVIARLTSCCVFGQVGQALLAGKCLRRGRVGPTGGEVSLER